MRVLLDENLPQKLRLRLGQHVVMTTAYRGWAGWSNGELVSAADAAGFDVLITADQGLNYQQNLVGRKLSLLVLSTNKNSLALAAVPKILAAINAIESGGFIFVELG